MPSDPLHLAVALDGAGWHPAAWREAGVRPDELFTAGYGADLVGEAEAGLLDLVTIEDSLGLQTGRWSGPQPRTDRVRGRLDAVLVANPDHSVDPSHRPRSHCHQSRTPNRFTSPRRSRRSTTSAAAGPESACRSRPAPARQRTSVAERSQ